MEKHNAFVIIVENIIMLFDGNDLFLSDKSLQITDMNFSG